MRALHLTDGRSARDAYDATLASRDGDAAAAVVTTLLDNGTPPIRVLTDVIAVAQRAVGGRWQRGEWSVAEEHAATATSVSATKIVRARALGATAWAPTASAAVAAMEKLPAVVPAVPPLAVDVADEHGALDVNQRALVERLSAEWSLTHLAETERGRVTREFAADAVRQVLHAVSAALLTGDPRPVAETATWICELLRTRGVTVNFTDELGRLLASALGDYPLAQAIVERHFPTTG